MSSSIGHNLPHQSFLAPTALEHQTKINPCCISGRNNLFQAQAYSRLRKSPISTKFWGNTLNVGRVKLPMGTHRVGSVFPRAVLATDPASEVLYSYYYDLRTFSVEFKMINLSGGSVNYFNSTSSINEQYAPNFLIG